MADKRPSTATLFKLRKDQLVSKVQRLTRQLQRAQRGLTIWQSHYATMEKKYLHERQRALNEEIISDGLRKRWNQ